MVAQTQYEKAKNRLNEHIGKTWSLNELRLFVQRYLASEEKTINSYMRMMKAQGLIQEIEHLKFKVIG